MRYVTLDRVPKITLPREAAMPATEKRKIEALIQSLALIGRPGFGYSISMEATTFPPVPEVYSGVIGAVGVNRPSAPNAMTQLVSAGPKALPFLLNGLTNRFKTQLEFRGGSEFIELYEAKPPLLYWWNPFNSRESAVLPSLQDDNTMQSGPSATDYRVSIGDLCFVTLGQIVGRSYSLVQGAGGSPQVCFNRPSNDSQLCIALHSVWGSDRPGQMLLDSLLLDFSTRARLDGKTDDFLGLATDLQTNAAVRLLYYYPDVAVPLVVARLDGLDVKAIPETGPSGLSKEEGIRFGAREQRNGVDTAQFVQSVAWCRDRRIVAALARVIARSGDKEILDAIRTLTRP